eukprot:149657-Prorocentrum_minimum.AAC.1
MSLDSARLITGPGCGGRAAIPLRRTLVRASYLYVTPAASEAARTGVLDGVSGVGAVRLGRARRALRRRGGPAGQGAGQMTNKTVNKRITIARVVVFMKVRS